MKRHSSFQAVTPFEKQDEEAAIPKVTPAALAAAAANDFKNVAVAMTPGGIEAQEKAGQIAQSFQDTLPIKMFGCGKKDFEALGFKFLHTTDRIFWQCEFPAGWRKKPAANSMWSNLLDDKGRNRASIFFKAAFYDYDAHIGLNQRYGVKTIYLDANKEEIFDRVTGEYREGKHRCHGDFVRIEVVDHTTGQALFTSVLIPQPNWDRREEGLKRAEQQDQAKAACGAWLDKHFPNWQKASAYWD